MLVMWSEAILRSAVFVCGSAQCHLHPTAQPASMRTSKPTYKPQQAVRISTMRHLGRLPAGLKPCVQDLT